MKTKRLAIFEKLEPTQTTRLEYIKREDGEIVRIFIHADINYGSYEIKKTTVKKVPSHIPGFHEMRLTND